MASYRSPRRASFASNGPIPEHFCSDLGWMEPADAGAVNFRLVYYTDHGAGPVRHHPTVSVILPRLIIPALSARMTIGLTGHVGDDEQRMIERIRRGALM
jgi:hypothetical protein